MYKNWYISSMEKNHAKSNKQPRGLKTIMSILNNRQAVKNAMNGEKTGFTFNGVTTPLVDFTKTLKTGLGVFNQAVLVPKGAKHSVLNKIVSVGLTATAAYYCGFPTWLIIIQTLLAVIASFEARRWFIEFGMIYPFMVTAITLQPNAIITFAVLVTYKSFLEIYCHIADRIIRALAALTADKAHSYYYFWVLGVVTLLSATHASSYFQGFFEGLAQGLAGN